MKETEYRFRDSMLHKMTLAFIILLLGVIAFSPPVAQAAELTVTQKYINLRQGPGTNHPIVGKVYQGKKLAATATKAGWYQVNYNGKTGWMAGWLVKVNEAQSLKATSVLTSVKQQTATSQSTVARKQAFVNITYVNVRTGPGTAFSLVGRLYKGDKLDVISISGQWVQVRLTNGKTGWVAGWLVQLTDVQQKPVVKPVQQPTQQPVQSQKPSLPAAQTIVQYAVVKGKTVNVRAGASTKNAIITTVKQGEKFKILSVGKEWLMVELANKRQAWIYSSLVTIQKVVVATSPKPGSETTTKPAEPIKEAETGGQQETSGNDVDLVTGVAVNKSVRTVKENINLRKGPATTFAVITTVNSGVYLNVLRETQEWYLVDLPSGQKGWLAAWLTETSLSTVPAQEQPVLQPVNYQPTEDVFKISIVGTVSNPVVEVAGVKGEYKTIADPEGFWYKLYLPEMEIPEAVSSEVYQGILKSYELKSIPDLSQGIELTIYLAEKATVSLKPNETGKSLRLHISSGGIAGKLIVVDAGHGGIDPGAIGPSGLQEKTVAFDIAKQVVTELERQGAAVIMTREDDTLIPLKIRADLANTKNADAFVSIHMNACPTPGVNGTAVYYYAPASIPSLYQQLEQRKALANAVQKQLVKALGTKDNGILQENFAVTRMTTMPSILVETAFISNPTEEQRFNDSNTRTVAAKAIAQGIVDYFTVK